MNKDEIVIATITWARDAQEYNRLCEAMQCLSKQGIPVVVADGGSGKELVTYLKGLPNLIVHECYENPRLLAQVRWSLMTARHLGARYVLYTESDKKWFFEHRLNDFVTQAPDDNQVGVVIASRAVESFLTFPEFQRYTETVANQLCAKVIGQDGDFVYGPLLINTTIIPYLDLINENIGWGWRFFTIAVSHRIGRPIVQLTLDLPCPMDQREEDSEETRIYRMHQLVQNIQGLVLAAKVSLDKVRP